MASFTSPISSESLPRLRRHISAYPNFLSPKTPCHALAPKSAHLPSVPFLSVTAKASRDSSNTKRETAETRGKKSTLVEEEEEIVEVEEDLPWIQEKALDLVEFTGSVTQAIPGPRVGTSSLPWILAVPLAYVGVSFVIAFVKTVKKFSSPREKRRRLVSVFPIQLILLNRFQICALSF